MSATKSKNESGPPLVRAKKTHQLGWVARILIGLAAVVGVALVLFLCVLSFGSVEGEEFSPDDFSRRNFTYFEIPVVRIQVSPVFRYNNVNELAAHLRQISYIPKSSRTEPHWDLVTASRGGTRWSGDAAILCMYLDARQDSEVRWLVWSREHPNLAKHLWPAVAEVARRNLYSLVPDLINLAEGAEDPDQFAGDLQNTLVAKYIHFARIHQAQDEHKQAVERFTFALDHQPTNTAARKGRAESYRALGKHDKAKADSK
jgi:hypothetical protein